MAGSVVVYAIILLACAWPMGWPAMVLAIGAYAIGICVGAALEGDTKDGSLDYRANEID